MSAKGSTVASSAAEEGGRDGQTMPGSFVRWSGLRPRDYAGTYLRPRHLLCPAPCPQLPARLLAWNMCHTPHIRNHDLWSHRSITEFSTEVSRGPDGVANKLSLPRHSSLQKVFTLRSTLRSAYISIFYHEWSTNSLAPWNVSHQDLLWGDMKKTFDY